VREKERGRLTYIERAVLYCRGGGRFSAGLSALLLYLMTYTHAHILTHTNTHTHTQPDLMRGDRSQQQLAPVEAK
jgi:hypothetical protein